MKCMNCEISVSPAFTKAIMDNLCPACGKEILGGNAFRELMRIRGLLQDLDLDEKSVVSAAAVISQKYDLVPKGSRKAAEPLPTEEEIEQMDGLSEEEKVRLRALQAAQEERKTEEEERIRKEWGMEYGQLGASLDSKPKGPVDPDMASLFDDATVMESDMPDPLPARQQNKNRNDERLLRAEALKADPGRFKVMRAE